MRAVSNIRKYSEMRKTLTIHRPKITNYKGKSRLVTTLELETETRELWVEVDEEYEKYLCYERIDAFLVAVLPYAMIKGYDINCVAQVTDEILYKINEHLLPTLIKSEKSFHFPIITAEYTNELLPNYGGVGTGISCGVDSFHSIAKHYNPRNENPKLTHLCVFKSGAFDTGFNPVTCQKSGYGHERALSDVVSKAKCVARFLSLPLIELNSNYYDVLHSELRENTDFISMFAYSFCFGILAMQKLWKTYFFASGYEYAQFVINAKEAATHDLLILNCFSTRQMHLYSEGGPYDRMEKLSVTAEFPAAQKYLHVCFAKGYNCGVCAKCSRTLLALDVSGHLDRFREVLPVDYYIANINNYLHWIVRRVLKNARPDVTVYDRLMQQGKYADRLAEIMKKLKSPPAPISIHYQSLCEAQQSSPTSPPDVRDGCICVMCADTGDVLFEKYADTIEKPGHTAMIVAGIVAIEQGKLDEIFAMPDVARFGRTTAMDYLPGEKMTLRDMLYGMMLPSYTDVADAIAVIISGSISAFADEMNDTAKRIGMKTSYFTSPHGVTSVEDRTTARDMAVAIQYALKNPVFREIIATPTYNANSSSGEHAFKSINYFLPHCDKEHLELIYPFCIGGQTGRVDGRFTFVSAACKDGHTNIVAQLGISDVYGFPFDWTHRFTDAKLLHEWAFNTIES